MKERIRDNMMKGMAFFAVGILAVSAAVAAPAKKKETKPLPPATFDSVPYGGHRRQVMDVWLPEKGAEASPVIVFIHGGGFTKGDRKDERLAGRIPKCLAANVAMIAVQSLAATVAYARKKKIMMLNTGDVFDFRSEMNIACIKL